jgi:2-haloacid dehalogenase/putative hydrolase of the HAD superfamily
MRPEIITFDCYGTLIDWNAGITGAFVEEARAQGIERVDEIELLAAYHDAEPRAQADEYRLYREVLALLEVEVASLLGWPPPLESRGYLAESLPSWPPFPETNAALEQLVAYGYKLGILSNIDDDLLTGTRRHFTVEFDLLVTAQQLRSYKPAPAHFERTLHELGGNPDRILHIAQSYFHDIRTATGLGIPTVWVNRLAEDLPGDGPIPTVEVRDMKEAADWVGARWR